MSLTWIAILYPLTLTFCVFIGYKIARNKYFLKQQNWKASGIESSIIALFGLILSFTLLLSGNASKDRIDLIHRHVDALVNLYRNSSLTTPPLRDITQSYVMQLLKEKSTEDRDDAFESDSLVSKSNMLYQKFWLSIVKAQEANPELKSEAKQLMVGINEAAALHYRIEYSSIERTPWILISMVTISSCLVGILVGFSNGFNTKDHFIVPIIFIVITSLVVLVIQDINNPTKGFFRPSLNNYTNAYDELRML